MDLMKIFQDEALVEILGFADVSWTEEDDRTTIWVRPFEEDEVTGLQMETVIDFFRDYRVLLNLISAPVFVIEDWPKEDKLMSEESPHMRKHGVSEGYTG